MEILWLVIGVLIGILIAWSFYMTAVRSEVGIQKAALAGQLEEARASRDGEREANQTRILDLEGRIREQQSEIARLQAEPSVAQSASDGAAATATGYEENEKLPVQAAQEATSSPDDLTRIKGIGQVLQGKLHQLEITTFRQIADFTQADIKRVNAVVGIPGRIERDQWVEQASAIVGWKPPKRLGRSPKKPLVKRRKP